MLNLLSEVSNILQNETEVGCWALAEVCASLSEWGSRLYSCRVVILPCSGDNYTIYCLPWGVKQTAFPAARPGLKILKEGNQRNAGLWSSSARMYRAGTQRECCNPTGYICLNMTFLPRRVAQCWLEMEHAHALGREWNAPQREVIPSQLAEHKVERAPACTLCLKLFWHPSFCNALKLHDSQLLGKSWRENLKLSFINKTALFSPAFPAKI